MSKAKGQVFKKSTIAYIGAIIGIISQLWIYPLAFDIYGDYQFVLAMVTFFMPWASLGILSLNNRFYPYFEKENRGNGFLTLQLVGIVISFTLFLLTITIFREQYFNLVEYIGFNVEVFKEYNLVILGTVFFLTVLTFLSSFSINLKEVVVPYVVSIFSWKLLLPILIILFVHGFISNITFFYSLPILYAFLALTMFGFIHRRNKIEFSLRITNTLKENYKPMLWFAGYGILSNYGNILAYTIDRIMIRGYTTDYDTGVYSMMVVLSGLILYPYDAITSVYTPFLAKKWKENDIDSIKEVNKKTSNTLSFITPFVFGLAYINITDIAGFTSNKEAFLTGISAFFYLGLAKSINGIFGLNQLTLNFSKHYYLLFFTTLLLGTVNVWLNSLLIPIYGMTGAAVASMISLVSVNLIIYAFNWYKYGVQPFDLKTLLVVFTIVMAMFFSMQIEVSSYSMINIVLRSLVFVGIVIPVVYKFNWVVDLNDFVDRSITRLRK